MKQIILILFPLIIFTSCYKTLSLDGFDKEKWKQFNLECSNYRLDISDHLIENRSLLLESNQNEIESLLGSATEHELYARNQKFFHYRVTPSDSCGFAHSTKFLSIRFNAIGLANEVQITVRE